MTWKKGKIMTYIKQYFRDINSLLSRKQKKQKLIEEREKAIVDLLLHGILKKEI